jgi:hypothetical protein
MLTVVCLVDGREWAWVIVVIELADLRVCTDGYKVVSSRYTLSPCS